MVQSTSCSLRNSQGNEIIATDALVIGTRLPALIQPRAPKIGQRFCEELAGHYLTAIGQV